MSKIKHHRYSSRLWLLAAIIAAALLLLFTKPAQAAEPVFVSNIDQAPGTKDNVDLTASDFAQGFTTGGNTGDANYDLGSIDFSVNGAPASVNNVTVKLYSSDDTGAPDAELCTLANPDNLETGDRRFGVRSSCASLTAATTYVVGMHHEGAVDAIGLDVTGSDAEDSGQQSGWSISNEYYFRLKSGLDTDWQKAGTLALTIRVQGGKHSPHGLRRDGGYERGHGVHL